MYMKTIYRMSKTGSIYILFKLSFFIISTVFIKKDVAVKVFSLHCRMASNICPDPKINFFLYTSEIPRTPVELSVNNNQALMDAPFVEGEIKLLIHGYTGNRDHTPNLELRPAYFQRNISINIISVDYGPLAKDGCYFQAVHNTGGVALCIAQLINALIQKRTDITISRFHIIALSLGAQVASQIQKHLNGIQIERLTALDAAFPLFYNFLVPLNKRLSKGDAKFMDAIHTNAGISGVWNPIADIDFYANGGIIQPGCGQNLKCSHTRSAKLYAASIDPRNKFLAYRGFLTKYRRGWQIDWNDVQLFGEYVNHRANGVYLFNTTDKSPYVLLPSQQ